MGDSVTITCTKGLRSKLSLSSKQT